MFNGIAEGHWAIYGLAIAIGLVVGIWQRNRGKPTWVGIVLGALLVGLISYYRSLRNHPKKRWQKPFKTWQRLLQMGIFHNSRKGFPRIFNIKA